MSGVVTSAKVMGIANRIRATPKNERGPLISELLAPIDEDGEEQSALGDLREMLT